MRRLLRALLRYPPEPAHPEGTPGSLRVLSSSPRYLAYRLITLWARLLVVFALEELFLHKTIKGDVLWIAKLAAFLVIVAIPGTIMSLTIWAEYGVRSYKLSDRALRIREGLFVVRETTMSFANIQNVSVSRGPVQGLFGISDVVLKTAGGGAHAPKSLTPDLHVAHFRGLHNAEEVRELVLDLLRKAKVDPDVPSPTATTLTSALADVHREAIAFRETAERVAT